MKDGDDTDFERKHAARNSDLLKKVGITVGIVAGLAGLAGTYITIPQRLDAVEKQIEKLKQEREADHDILTHINARLEFLRPAP